MGMNDQDLFGMGSMPTDYVSSPNVGDYYDWSPAPLSQGFGDYGLSADEQEFLDWFWP